MTRKQFEWLRMYQPIEVTYVEPYYRSKHPFCYHISSVEFNGEYLRVKGVKHHYIANRWKEEHYDVKIHRRNIRQVRYRKL